jgi:hypothetical protein
VLVNKKINKFEKSGNKYKKCAFRTSEVYVKAQKKPLSFERGFEIWLLE